jgi:hypothetical protein
MSTVEFLRRLQSGQAVRHIYRVGHVVGMIAVYPFAGVFVLHWEESRAEAERNRGADLRDEMHRFETAGEALAFVERCGYPAAEFGP